MFDDTGFDLSKWGEEVTLTLNLGDLLVLHGQLSLALRHPGNIKASSERARQLVNNFERMMLERGMASEKALRAIRNDERAARGRG